MKFSIVGIFKRSITIEIENEKPYNLDVPYTVLVNGEAVKT